MAARSSVSLKTVLNDATVIISLGLVHLIKFGFPFVLSAHAFSSPLFYYYFPSSKFYICFFPSFIPLFARSFSFFLSLIFFFFSLSFRLLVCRSVGLSSLILSRSFWPRSPFVLRIFILKSVSFNKPKLFPYPQNSCNT